MTLEAEIEALLNQTRWHQERHFLRSTVLDCGLVEQVKWAKLCFAYAEKNVAIFYGFKDYFALGFFKGSLLPDPLSVLHKLGEHSQALRVLKFTNLQEAQNSETTIRSCIFAAIEIEKAGLKVAFKEKDNLILPDELLENLNSNIPLRTAFDALTPGRQRGYVLHISGAKQSETRCARVKKCAARILAGKGLNDR